MHRQAGNKHSMQTQPHASPRPAPAPDSTTSPLVRPPATSAAASTAASSSHTESSPSPTADDVFDLVPGVCEGAAPLVLLLAGFLLWTLVVPLAALLPLSFHYTAHASAIRAAMYTMIGSGVLYLLVSSRELFMTLLSCSASAPLSAQPLRHTADAPNPSTAITVTSVLVVVNPHGGVSDNRRIYQSVIAPFFASHDVGCTAVFTSHSGHARTIAASSPLASYSAIVVVGGDGTLHEVVNGLLSRTDLPSLPPVGLIPCGTGNAMATDLGTLDVEAACMRVVRGQVCWIDVNHLHSSSSLCPLSLFSVETINWGLVGNVAVQAELPIARRCGGSRYNLCAVWSVLKGYSCLLSLSLPSSAVSSPSFPSAPPPPPSLSASMVTLYINNTQYFAKSLRAAPFACLDDGKLDILLLSAASSPFLLALFLLLPSGAHVVSPKVRYLQAAEATVRVGQEGQRGVMCVDGEIVECEGEVHVRCCHKLLPILMESEWRGRQVPGLKERKK